MSNILETPFVARLNLAHKALNGLGFPSLTSALFQEIHCSADRGPTGKRAAFFTSDCETLLQASISNKSFRVNDPTGISKAIMRLTITGSVFP